MDNTQSTTPSSSRGRDTGRISFSLTADQAAALLGFLNDHLPDDFRGVARTDSARLQRFLGNRYDHLREVQEELKEICHANEIHYLPPIGE